jgi:hypothetical protein
MWELGLEAQWDGPCSHQHRRFHMEPCEEITLEQVGMRRSAWVQAVSYLSGGRTTRYRCSRSPFLGRWVLTLLSVSLASRCAN